MGTGQLVISLRTVGDQLDPDGFALSIESGLGTPLPINGEIRVSSVTAGSRSYQLSGVASNCRLTNRQLTGTVLVSQGGESGLDFEVLCLEPDPGRIFYTLAEGEIRSMSALGGDRQQLPLFAYEAQPSRSGETIAFDWDDDIWVASTDGSSVTNVTSTPDRREARPGWSPDGQRITYERNEVPGESESDIFVINVDGTGITNLTPDTPLWTDGEPDWSPDGARIAFRSHRSSGGDLWTVAPDGSQLTQLTTGGSFDTNPRWSPDGEELVFTRFMGSVEDGGTDFELFIINADGTGLRQLTNDAVASESRRTTEADWSPDGRWIVFASLDFDATPSVFDLYLIRADGQDRIQITHGERAGLPSWVP